MQGITPTDIKKLQAELDSCQRPLFLYDDDADGLCSFLLLYRYKKEGVGVVVKRSQLDLYFKEKVASYGADKVFILDVPKVEENFVTSVNVPVIWVDHHAVKDLPLHLYINPRLKDPDAYVPVSAICYEVVKQDAWIGAIGCVADAYLPDFIVDVQKAFPTLFNEISDEVSAVRYNSAFGKIVRIISFVMKDTVSRVNAIAKILTRMESPMELFLNNTPRAQYIYNAYKKIAHQYEDHIAQAKKEFMSAKDKSLLYFEYGAAGVTVTTELCNELFHLYPDALVIVAREKEEKVSMSLRYKYDLPEILQPILEKLGAVGGGHKHACGASISTADKEFFLTQLKTAIEDRT